TSDPERAEAFYSAVFGWEVLPVGAGLAWRRPGYGDHLEELTPGMREGMAAMGAPAHFEDVVASIVVGAGAERWDVTFAVDDGDAARPGVTMSPWPRLRRSRSPTATRCPFWASASGRSPTARSACRRSAGRSSSATGTSTPPRRTATRRASAARCARAASRART